MFAIGAGAVLFFAVLFLVIHVGQPQAAGVRTEAVVVRPDIAEIVQKEDRGPWLKDPATWIMLAMAVATAFLVNV